MKSFALGAVRNQEGYRKIHLGGGVWEWEHRLVLQQKLGRALLPGRITHHLNGDRADNRPENLIEVTRQEHCAIHPAALDENGRVPSFEEWRASRFVEVVSCHPGRKHAGRGLCRSCLMKENRAKDPEKYRLLDRESEKRRREKYPERERLRKKMQRLRRRERILAARPADWKPAIKRGPDHYLWKGGPRPKISVPRQKRIPECHPERKHAAKGLCTVCYGEKLRRAKGVKAKVQGRAVPTCHPDSPYGGLGLCRKCYMKQQYQIKKQDPAYVQKTRESALRYWRKTHPPSTEFSQKCKGG